MATTTDRFELDLLYDVQGTGTIVAGNRVNLGETRLERDERAEIVYLEIISPVTGPGVVEDLASIIPFIDGRAYLGGTNVVIKADYNGSFMPLRQSVFGHALDWSFKQLSPGNLFGRSLATFGVPRSADSLINTTIKVKETINFVQVASRPGGSNVTQNRRVRAWGYRYKGEAALRRAFGNTYASSTPVLNDPSTNRKIPIPKTPLPVTLDNFTKFAGGQDQDEPTVNPFWRWSQPSTNTTPSTDYSMSFRDGRVASDEENLDFDFDENDALLIERLGIREAANLLDLEVRINDQVRPKGRFPTRVNENSQHFGLGDPYLPFDTPLWMPIPLLDTPFLIHNEIGVVQIRDDGTAIVAPTSTINGPTIGFAGKRIKLKK